MFVTTLLCDRFMKYVMQSWEVWFVVKI